jgi:hypothetical protein
MILEASRAGSPSAIALPIAYLYELISFRWVERIGAVKRPGLSVRHSIRIGVEQYLAIR